MYLYREPGAVNVFAQTCVTNQFVSFSLMYCQNKSWYQTFIVSSSGGIPAAHVHIRIRWCDAGIIWLAAALISTTTEIDHFAVGFLALIT